MIYRRCITPINLQSIRFLSYKYSKKIDCTPHQIYDVVIDIKNYKTFIPFVIDSFDNIASDDAPSLANLNRKETDQRETATKSMTEDIEKRANGGFVMDWKGYQERINCDITYIPNTKVISQCSTGIFKHLYVEWNFKPFNNTMTKKDQTNVELILDYEFNNFLYNNLSSMVNQQLSKLMIKSFEKEIKNRCK